MDSQLCRFLYGPLDGQELMVRDRFNEWMAATVEPAGPWPGATKSARYLRQADDLALFVCAEEPPATNPHGGCFGHPIGGGGRWCRDIRTVATITPGPALTATNPASTYHPDWRACQYHADQAGGPSGIGVNWDEGQGPR